MFHVIDEGKRCLQCKRPACRPACPVGTDVPKMVDCFLTNRIDEAGAMLFDNNPLSVITSLVCDHMKQCEGHCILNRKASAIHVSSIEHYISERFLDRYKPEPVTKLGKRAAVIGSGPAGMTIAMMLARRGYDITMFDSRDKIGGVLRYGIPEFRLPNSILDRYQVLMQQMGIRIRPNATIGGTLRIEDLFRDGYLAVSIGTGVWRPRSMSIKGESLGNVHFAIDYLASPKSFDLGATVSVIGAGNAAMDVARTAVRNGVRNVTVYARKPTFGASPVEVEYAEIDGVRFHPCAKPVEITPEGAIFRDVSYDEKGEATELTDTDKLYPSDSVIIAVGQGPKDKIISTSKGIEVDKRGLVVTDSKGETTRPGIFASGDVVSGAKTVVEAVHYSKGVAEAMDKYMQNL